MVTFDHENVMTAVSGALFFFLKIYKFVFLDEIDLLYECQQSHNPLYISSTHSKNVKIKNLDFWL